MAECLGRTSCGPAADQDLSAPAQRMWRDIGTATRHPAFVTEINRERYGQLLMDIAV